jgi:hypothetical protein
MSEYPATGTLLQVGVGGVPEEYSTVATIVNIGGPALSNPALDVTGLEDQWKQYISSGVYAGGELTFTVVLDPGDANHAAMFTNTRDGTEVEFCVCWSNLTGNSLAFAAADVDAADEHIDEVAHGLHTGQPIRFTTAGTMPANLVAGTTYYAIYASANTYRVAATNVLALVPTPINIDEGVGNHTMWYGDKYVFQGIVTGASPSGSVGNRLEGTITIQVTGTVTL